MMIARALRAILLIASLSALGSTAHAVEIPLSFEANRGQTDERVRFLARAADHDVFVTDDEVVLALRSGAHATALRMRVAGGGPAREVGGLEDLATRSHYLIGNDRGRWRTDVPHYGRIVQRSVRAGIDVEMHATAGHLEYDLVLAPGLDPASVAIDFDGADAITVDADGSLRIATGAGDVVQRAPFAYQEVAGTRRKVEVAWQIETSRRIGFTIGAHDPRTTLVIDPVVEYATYLGAAGADAVQGVAVDASGSAYVTGVTASLLFPTVAPYQPAKGGDEEAWLAKFTPDGAGLVYATFLGGSGSDSAWSVAVDAAGNAAVVGETGSANFPILNAAQPTLQGAFDAFVASYDAAGARRWATYLGGEGPEIGRAVAVEPDGSVHAGGQTQSCAFPTLAAIQAACGGLADGFVASYGPAGALLFSTYLGGTGDDYVFAVAADRNGSTYATGRTGSANFPVLHALQSLKAASADAYVTKFARSGALLYSTFLGGSGPDNFTTIAELFRNGGIAVDAGASVFVAGLTQSADFPLAHPFQPTLAGSSDATIARLTPDGQALVYSSFLGGTAREAARAIAIDAAGAAYVVGDTESSNFPITAPAFQTATGGGPDGFIVKVSGTPACANGVDDDGDLAVDFPNDPGCESAASLVESPPCNDGFDNDGDGHTDRLDDPECYAASDVSERADCGDGIDNDGDGLVDAADPACSNPSPVRESSKCQNGIDDDRDGKIDFDGGATWNKGVPIGARDPECTAPYRNQETAPSCGLGGELVVIVGGVPGLRRRLARRRRDRAS